MIIRHFSNIFFYIANKKRISTFDAEPHVEKMVFFGLFCQGRCPTIYGFHCQYSTVHTDADVQLCFLFASDTAEILVLYFNCNLNFFMFCPANWEKVFTVVWHNIYLKNSRHKTNEFNSAPQLQSRLKKGILSCLHKQKHVMSCRVYSKTLSSWKWWSI